MNIEKYIEDGCYTRKITKRHTLYELTKYKGYSEELCLFLHAKTLECLSFIWEVVYPYLDVLAEAVIDECEEKDILQMSLGQMDYVFRHDYIDEGENPRLIDRENAMDSGKEAYAALLKPNGDFDYQKAYREIIEKHPDFPDIMKKSGHPLPF